MVVSQVTVAVLILKKENIIFSTGPFTLTGIPNTGASGGVRTSEKTFHYRGLVPLGLFGPDRDVF